MFAVVDINGQQFKVEENQKYYVPRLDKKPNSKISFDSVLLFGDDKETKVGNPAVDGLKVSAKVLEHVQDDKLVVFQKEEKEGL